MTRPPPLLDHTDPGRLVAQLDPMCSDASGAGRGGPSPGEPELVLGTDGGLRPPYGDC